MKRKSPMIIKTLYDALVYILGVSKFYFILLLFLTIILGVSSFLYVWSTKLLINGIASVSSSNLKSMVFVLILYGFVNLSVRLLEQLNLYLKSRFQLIIEQKSSQDILEKCTRLSLADYEDSEKYDSITKGDSQGSSRLISLYFNFLNLFVQLISILSISALIISIRSYALILIIVYPIASFVYSSKLNKTKYEIKMKRTLDLRKLTYFKYLLTNDIACKEIKMNNNGKYISLMYKKNKKMLVDEDTKILRKKSIVNAALSILDEFINAFIIFYIILMAISGKLKIGDSVAIIESLNIVQKNVEGTLNSISEIYNDSLYVRNFFELLRMDEETPNDRYVKIDKIENIIFKNVSFKYKNTDNFALKNLNLKIISGDKIVIVGDNGSGKSTFMKLLCGFYTEYDGEILINDIDLRDIDKINLRELYGVVFQDYNKYEMSLRNNIGLGYLKEINNNKKIIDTLNKINLGDKFKKYENIIDIQMGKWFGGHELSKGQWQRIAIGRALFKDSKFYILDEPTASIDPIFDRMVNDMFLDDNNEDTCIIITHRLENLKAYNPRIIVFSNGEIVEKSDKTYNFSIGKAT